MDSLFLLVSHKHCYLKDYLLETIILEYLRAFGTSANINEFAAPRRRQANDQGIRG